MDHRLAADCNLSSGVALLDALQDDHPWVRRGATYALGRLGLTEAVPRLREGLYDAAPEVRLATVWALGALRDDGARDDLIRLLYQTRTTAPGVRDSEGDETPGLVSDAETRLFDAIVQALGRLAHGVPDPLIHRSLVHALERLSEEELDRLARLPLPELQTDHPPPTLRALFESALPAAAEDEDSG